MYPLHDKDLDRLSREAAEHFEVEPGASGWANLEKRLDIELPQKKKRRRFLFWLFFITATTGGALTAILTYKPVTPLGNNAPGIVTPTNKPSAAQQHGEANTALKEGVKNDPTTGNAPTVTPSQTAVNPKPVAGNQVPDASLSTSPESNTTDANKPANNTALSTSPDKSTAQPVVKTGKHIKSKPAPHAAADKRPLSLNYTTITPDNRGRDAWHTTKPSKQKQGKQQRTITGGHKPAVNTGADNTTTPDRGITANNQAVKAEPDEVNPDPSNTMQATATPADSMKNNIVAPPVADSTKTLVTETPKKEADPKKDKNEKGLELGLIAGPDVSAVAFGPLYKTGYNFGLQVGYRFSNRWSVNTGIIYTKKFYKADGEDFHYKSPWGYKLEKAEGNCSMWEIPVNVRYDVSFNTKRRWFVSTGLSTYLMDNEYYDLYYTWSGNPVPPYPMDSDSNTNYFFSILNVSAGMERSLGKRFSIQAEPYLKVPLRGLGKGDIRMDSYGIYFTLKYKPGFRTKRSLNNK